MCTNRQECVQFTSLDVPRITFFKRIHLIVEGACGVCGHRKGKLPFQIPNKMGANYKAKVNETHSLLLVIVPAELWCIQQYWSCTFRLPTGAEGSFFFFFSFFFLNTYTVMLVLNSTSVQ